MSGFSKESAFFDSLSDEESYHKYNQEQTAKRNYEDKNNQFKDKSTFSGEVLLPCQECTNITPLSDNLNEKVYVTKVRCETIDDNILDHPSDAKDPMTKQMITDQHQTAYISIDPTVQSLPKPGDKVECKYNVAGPNEEGKQRGLQISTGGGSTSSSSLSIALGGSSGGLFDGNAQKFPVGQFSSNDAAEYKPDNYQIPNKPFLEKLYKSFGLTFTDIKPGDLRLVAVRYPVKSSNVNKFSDVLNVFYQTNSGLTVKAYQITTIPAEILFQTDTYNIKGTGLLATAYTKNMYKLGTHTGYAAGAQRSESYAMRDNNRNGVPDLEPDGTDFAFQVFGAKGWNLHRSTGKAGSRGTNVGGSYNKPGTGSTTYAVIDGKLTERKIGIWAFSAGCQVFSSFDEFQEMIAFMQNNKNQNKIEYYDYFLLNYADYVSLMTSDTPTFDGKKLLEKREANKLLGDEIIKRIGA